MAQTKPKIDGQGQWAAMRTLELIGNKKSNLEVRGLEK